MNYKVEKKKYELSQLKLYRKLIDKLKFASLVEWKISELSIKAQRTFTKILIKVYDWISDIYFEMYSMSHEDEHRVQFLEYLNKGEESRTRIGE